MAVSESQQPALAEKYTQSFTRWSKGISSFQKNGIDPQDMVQDKVVELLEDPTYIDVSRHGFDTYVRKGVLFNAIDQARRKKKEIPASRINSPEYAFDDDYSEEDKLTHLSRTSIATSFEDIIVNEREFSNVVNSIKKILTSSEFNVLILVSEGLKHEEIAAVLNRSQHLVKTILFRAREKLTAALPTDLNISALNEDIYNAWAERAEETKTQKNSHYEREKRSFVSFESRVNTQLWYLLLPGEFQVVQLTKKGLSTTAVSQELGISPDEVRTYLSEADEKLRQLRFAQLSLNKGMDTEDRVRLHLPVSHRDIVEYSDEIIAPFVPVLENLIQQSLTIGEHAALAYTQHGYSINQISELRQSSKKVVSGNLSLAKLKVEVAIVTYLSDKLPLTHIAFLLHHSEEYIKSLISTQENITAEHTSYEPSNQPELAQDSLSISLVDAIPKEAQSYSREQDLGVITHPSQVPHLDPNITSIYLGRQSVTNIATLRSLLNLYPDLKYIQIPNSAIRLTSKNFLKLLEESGIDLRIARVSQYTHYDDDHSIKNNVEQEKFQTMKNDANLKPHFDLMAAKGSFEYAAAQLYYDQNLSVRKISQQLGLPFNETMRRLISFRKWMSSAEKGKPDTHFMKQLFHSQRETNTTSALEMARTLHEVEGELPPLPLPRAKWETWKRIKTLFASHPQLLDKMRTSNSKTYAALSAFFCLDQQEQNPTLETIGDQLGITKERVRQLVSRFLAKYELLEEG